MSQVVRESQDGKVGLYLLSQRCQRKTVAGIRKRQIWLKICGKTKLSDLHVVNVTKPILSVSCLCEHGVEIHLAKKSFLRSCDGHEPLIKRGGVYFVKPQTVNAMENSCVRVDGRTEIYAYELTDQKIHAYELTDQKIHAYELMDDRKKFMRTS